MRRSAVKRPSEWVQKETKAAELPSDAKARTKARVKKRAATRLEKFVQAMKEDKEQANSVEEDEQE